MAIVPFSITPDLKLIDYLDTASMVAYKNTPADDFFNRTGVSKDLIKYIPIKGTNERVCLANKAIFGGSLSVDSNMTFRADGTQEFKNVVDGRIQAFEVSQYAELMQFTKRSRLVTNRKKYSGDKIKTVTDKGALFFKVNNTQHIYLPDLKEDFISYDTSKYCKTIIVRDYVSGEHLDSVYANLKNETFDFRIYKYIVLSRIFKNRRIYYVVRDDYHILEYTVEQIFESNATFLGVTKNDNKMIIEDLTEIYEYDMDKVYETHMSRPAKISQRAIAMRLIGKEYNEVITESGKMHHISTDGSLIMISDKCKVIEQESIELSKCNKKLIIPYSVEKVYNKSIYVKEHYLSDFEIEFEQGVRDDVIVKIIRNCLFKVDKLEVKLYKLDVVHFTFLQHITRFRYGEIVIRPQEKVEIHEAKEIVKYVIDTFFSKVIEYVKFTKCGVTKQDKIFAKNRWQTFSEIWLELINSSSCTEETTTYIKNIIEHMNNTYISRI